MQVNDVFNIINQLKPLEKTEQITLENAINRILATDILAKRSLPSFDNSALDGYAFDYAFRHLPLKVVGAVFAGDTNALSVKKGEAAKIMTGAAFPKGTNSVVAFEDALFDEKGFLLVPKNTKKNNAHKIAGEELKKGELILKKGSKLSPKELMLLASQGISQISVFSRPKIALFSTGSEVKEPWDEASIFEVYNSNMTAIKSLLAFYEYKYFGIIKDNKDEILNNIKNSLEYDIIITTGGASKGEADFMQQIADELGFKAIFNSINFRPAKPTKLFSKDNKLLVVLPGNPLSAFVAAFLFALPIIKKLEGWQNPLQPSFDAILASELTLNATRDNLVIGTYENGIFYPYNEGKFSPSQIMPLVLNNAIAVIPAGTAELKAKKIIKIFKIS